MAEGMFPQHPRSGPWETLKGSMLAPHIAQPIEGGTPTTTPVDTTSMNGKWNSGVIVTTGMTRGGGTMAH
jgi:hypothetical protein